MSDEFIPQGQCCPVCSFLLKTIFNALYRVGWYISVYLSVLLSADNGFIPESLLEDVMKALDLVSEPE